MPIVISFTSLAGACLEAWMRLRVAVNHSNDATHAGQVVDVKYVRCG